MNRTQIRQLIEDVQLCRKRSDEWLDKIPREISSAFFDNPYVEELEMLVDKLIGQMLGDGTLHQDVMWFINEWKPGYDITVGEQVYVINGIDDYLNYLVNEMMITSE